MSFPFRSDSDPFVVFFSSRTFSSKWERRWYTRIVLFKCFLLAKDPTSTIGRSPGYSNKLCFMWFSHVTTSVPIRSIRNGSVKHSIREPGLYSSVWYSFSFGSWNHIQQWLEQLAKSNHFTYFIAPNRISYLYWNRMVSCSFIDWLFLSVRISFSNCGVNEFTRLNGAGPRVGELLLQKWNERPFKLRHCMHTSTMEILKNLLSKGAEMKCDQISGLTDQTNLAQLQPFKAWQNVLPICPTNRAICDPSLEFRQVR